MQRHFIHINGKKLSYLDEGDLEAPVILLGHSFLWNADMWESQINTFTKKGYRCIAPDLWGHGESDVVYEKKYSIEALAEDYRLFLEVLHISSVTLVGLSVGGMWGTRLALNYPNLINALVIMDSYVGDEPVDAQTRLFGLMDELLHLQHFSKEYAKKALPFFFSPESINTNKNYVSAFERDLHATPRTNINSIVSIGYGIFSRNSMLKELSKIAYLPSLIIVGEKDAIRSIEEAQAMATLLKSCCIVIKNAGHIPTAEEPEQVTKILSTFLSSIRSKAPT